MKFIKKAIFIFILAMVLNVNSNLLAGDDYVEVLEQSSIRLKTEDNEQGLRFYAKLSEKYKNHEHGFYIMYGKATLDDLLNASTNEEGSLIVNEKIVYHQEIKGHNKDNTFSIVLVGIPEVGYLDFISVVSYVLVNETKHYSNVFTRSIAETALTLVNNNFEHEQVTNILDVIKSKKRISYNNLNQYEITSSLFETNYKFLKEEFIKDYNKSFNNFIMQIEEIEEENLDSFFNYNKWSWLISFFNSLNEEISLNNLKLLKDTILSFFQNKYINSEALDFSNELLYKNIENYNDQVYISTFNYEFYNVGESILLKEHPFANITSYLIDEEIYNVNSLYEVKEDITFINIIDNIHIVYKAYGEVISNYDFVSYSEGVIIEDNKDYNEIIFTITLKEGFIYSDSITVTSVFHNGKKTDVHKFEIIDNIINYAIDDPNWSPAV